MSISEIARAKVNLCLHVTGRRVDGMHLLDSIVVFPKIGDVLSAEKSDELTLEIDGPFGSDLTGSNLVIEVAQMMKTPATLRLTKNLPVASGIGGGSSDAAACMRLLSKLANVPLPAMDEIANLGADIPVCLSQSSTRMRGIGETLSSLPSIPKFWVLLVNAGQAVNTVEVFGEIENVENASLKIPNAFYAFDEFVQYLLAQRNDMQSAAIKICPVIAEVLSKIANSKDCALSKMSGSGGTCFGIFEHETAAKAAANSIQASHPNWWVVAAAV